MTEYTTSGQKTAVIPKELLQTLKFTQKDVLTEEREFRLRNIYLKKAEKLGNTYKGKVKIYFITDKNEPLAVETTIWSVNERFITLKAGVTIPITAIYRIEF